MSAKWKGTVGEIFSPAEFRVYLSDVVLGAFKPKFIVVHNTQIPTKAQWRGRRSIDSLVGYYRDEQGWSGGPHLFIDGDGIWVFTPLDKPGVHSPSWNDESWGVEIVGDFDTESFIEPQRGLVTDALTALHHHRGWLAPNIRLHKEDPKTTHTTCPGRAIVKAELEAGIAARLK